MDYLFTELPFYGFRIFSNKELEKMEQIEKRKIDKISSIQQKKLDDKNRQHELLLLAKQNYNKLKYDEHIARQMKRERKQLRAKIDREYMIQQSQF